MSEIHPDHAIGQLLAEHDPHHAGTVDAANDQAPHCHATHEHVSGVPSQHADNLAHSVINNATRGTPEQSLKATEWARRHGILKPKHANDDWVDAVNNNEAHGLKTVR